MSSPRKDPKTGTWFFVVELGRDGTGRRRQAFRRGYPTKSAAQNAIDDLRTSKRHGTFVAPSQQTVGEYLLDWLDAQRIRLKRGTIDSYRRNIVCYVIPYIGEIRLDQLRASHLDELYVTLSESGKRRTVGGLKPRSVRYVHTVISKALKDAVRKGTLSRNVAEVADPPTAKAAKAPEMKWWTPDELHRFLELTADEPYGPLFRLAGMTGMRRGECCGLDWSNVNLDRATVWVRRQLLCSDTHELYWEDIPKTDAGRRTIDLDAETVAVLRAQRARQSAHKLALGGAYQDQNLVFAQVDGTPIDPESMTHVFERRVARYGLPRIRFHDLRHTHATHLIAGKQDVLLISKRLGHASVSFTLDQYGHLFDSAGAGAAAVVAAMVDSAVIKT